jgi:DHA1 family multidrug resistance protein-like MFS transporter
MVVAASSTDARKINSGKSKISLLHSSGHHHHNLHRRRKTVDHLCKLQGGGGEASELTRDQTVVLKQRTISALHLTSFLIVLSTSIVAFTPLPSITRHFTTSSSATTAAATAATTATTTTTTTTTSPQEQAVKILSYISAASAAVELFLSPLLGTLLDRFGRKRPSVLLHSLITITNLLVVLQPSVWSIFTSRIINVLCSGFLIIVANSIIGDLFSGSGGSNGKDKDDNVHDKDQMGTVLGKQAACISSGFLFGSLLGGRLTEFGERFAYGGALIFSFMAALTAAFRMADSMDLTSSGQAPASSSTKDLDWSSLKRSLWEAPLSSIQLLFHYGKHMRTLAVLLLLQSAPIYMGDVFQVFAKDEWGLTPKDFGKFVALFGVLGILSNSSLSLIVGRLGLRKFSLFAIVSSLFFPLTAIFTNSYRYVMVAGIFGLYSGAQKVGTTAAITSLANELGLPQGQLQGEKASMSALLKIICPVIYSTLYLKGKEWSNMGIGNDDRANKLGLQMIMRKLGKKLPFVLNCILSVMAFAVTWQNL